MLSLQAKINGSFQTVATIETRGDQALVSILWSKQSNWLDLPEREYRKHLLMLQRVYTARNKGVATKIVQVSEVEKDRKIEVKRQESKIDEFAAILAGVEVDLDLSQHAAALDEIDPVEPEEEVDQAATPELLDA